MRKRALVTVTILSVMSACSQPLSRREQGALGGGVLGAGAGAIIGSQKGNAAEGAAIGGALGALAGGMLGNQGDKQAAAAAEIDERVARQQAEIARNQELIDELRRRNLDARGSARGVIVNLPDILFDFGQATLTRDAGGKVGDIAEIVTQRVPDRRLSVEGHTDSIGGVDFNQRLSERRAQAVATTLELHGVNRHSLTVRGFGKSSPVAPNANPDGSDNPEGRQRNRRVEVVILN